MFGHSGGSWDGFGFDPSTLSPRDGMVDVPVGLGLDPMKQTWRTPQYVFYLICLLTF